VIHRFQDSPQALQEDPSVQSLSPAESETAAVVGAISPYRMLAWLWCLVTPGAVFLMIQNSDWRREVGWKAMLQSVRIEQWVGLALVLVHGWFIVQALRNRQQSGPETRLPTA
jgi:hypothetical protein